MLNFLSCAGNTFGITFGSSFSQTPYPPHRSAKNIVSSFKIASEFNDFSFPQ